MTQGFWMLLLLLQLQLLVLGEQHTLHTSAQSSLHNTLLSLATDAASSSSSSSDLIGNFSQSENDTSSLLATFASADELHQQLMTRGLPRLLASRAALTAHVLLRGIRLHDSECAPVLNDVGIEAVFCRHQLHVGCVRLTRRWQVEIVLLSSQLQCQFLAGLPPADGGEVAAWQQSVSDVLRRESAKRLLQHPLLTSDLPSNETSEMFLRQRWRRSARSNKNLASNVKNFVSKFPWLERLVKSSRTSEPIRRITSRGFVTFSQKAALQAVEAVEPSRLSQFADYLLESLDVAAAEKQRIRAGVFDLLPFTASQEWQDFRMLFRAGSGGHTKYVNILANRDSDGYHFIIADFQTTFSLAPDLLVVEKSSSSMWGAFGSSKTVIRKIPASISDADMDVLMTFFDLAAFRRFAQMLQVPLGRRQRRVAAMGWIAAINAGIDTYKKFASAFSTKKTSQIVGKIVGKGFDYFSMQSRVHVISRMQPSYLERYLSVINVLYDLPRKYLAEIRIVLEMVQFIGHQDWNKNDFLFDVNSGGQNGWVTILSNRNEDGTYNFLIANVKQRFRLAPNILIIKESKSVAGGIYQSEKYKFKRIPRSITEADLESLTNFFNIITFKRFGMRFEVDTTKLDTK